MSLQRTDLARLAMLVGSDYTSGVRNVGIVNAVEILRAFPGSSGLQAFKEWLNHRGTAENATTAQSDFAKSHRWLIERAALPVDFPSDAVYRAYLEPLVSRPNSRD